MHVIFHDVEAKLALGNARPATGLDRLLAQSDIVTLHVPETLATAGMIGTEELAKMRQGAVLINASRGSVVDIQALAEALSGGHLGGAAIDVYPTEPKSNSDPFESPLIGLDNVILTPHVGGSTQEAQSNIGREVSAKLIRYSDNGSTLSAVNFPEVAPPEYPNSRRLLHIHRNEPGVMSHINELFSREDINIDGQYLRTTADLGYVIIDVSTSDELVLRLKRQLDDVPGTVRTRMLY